ncbi:BNR repeat domain protein [Minicystis rosea]|nr:BNR repeat domain protein [Minicystis rosea]
MTAIALLGVGCSSTTDSPTGTGAGGTTTAPTTSSTGGAGGDPVDAGDAGDAQLDAPPDAPPGSCVTADDCPAAGIACMGPACVNGACTVAPAFDFSGCDDGNPCTENDYCAQGTCTGTPIVCEASDACHAGTCDPLLGCTDKPANDGASCDDGDPCTGNGACASGFCQKGVLVDCSFLDGLCTVGVCDAAQGCIAKPTADGVPCDDNLFCTINDHCQGGTCVGGGPKACTSGNPCFVGACNEALGTCTVVPGNDGAACDDGNVCTASTTCLAGACVGGVPANDGLACDDGSACTVNTVCTGGKCGGGQGPTIYFADDFHDNSKGWTLGTEWQIGPTSVSNGQDNGNPDPALDHTSTNDNGVAGVALGGNAAVTGSIIHGQYYLTSPPFNTASASGSVMLGFYRWLNSDFAPYMTNVIEVWNGTAWIQIWKSSSTISDNQWVYVSHDITVYKNAAMQIRFGFDIGKTDVFTVSSWNIDDVQIASAACP